MGNYESSAYHATANASNANDLFPLALVEQTPPPTPMNESKLEPWKILIVDDEVEVHQVTQLALHKFTYSDRGLLFLSAYSAVEAQKLLCRHADIAIILLDVVMESQQAGLELIKYIREDLGNRTLRIILRTGQPGEAPEEWVIRQYDINDYKTKTELTRQRLVATMLISLRAYQHILEAETSQQTLAQLYTELQERNRDLQKAKDAAEEANHAKDEFLSVMNHELRTPLNVILMRAEIVQSGIYGSLTLKQNNSLELIMRSGHQLLAIIDDILDLVSMENGRMKPLLRRVSLRSIGDQSLHLVDDLAQKKAIQITVNEIDEAVYILSDERRLVQILEKLLKNAVKFSAEGARIGVAIEADAAADVIRIVVWDTGIGIAKEDMHRLFQPFVQLEHSLTRRYEGAGIGLTIAARLIELLGGTIAVESAVGAGSRFIVTLPVAIVH